MYKEQFNEYAKSHPMSARQYLAMIKLATGDPTLSSADAVSVATEDDYKKIITALSLKEEK